MANGDGNGDGQASDAAPRYENLGDAELTDDEISALEDEIVKAASQSAIMKAAVERTGDASPNATLFINFVSSVRRNDPRLPRE